MQKLILACSGGVDSMYLLNKLRQYNSEGMVIAHYNHKWSNKETEDALWLENYCKENNLTFELGTNNTGNKTETMCRDFRYNFLNEVRKKYSYKVIALAHHLDDQIETFLFRLCRGTGLAGVSGMQEYTHLWNEPSAFYWRPLLNLTKEEIISKATKLNIPYIEDESNNDLSKKRNLIRHKLIPILEELNPKYKQALTNFIEICDEADDFTEEYTQALFYGIDSEIGNRTTNGFTITDKNFFNKQHKTIQNKIISKLDPLFNRKRLTVIRNCINNNKENFDNLGNGWSVKKTGEKGFLIEK